MRCFGLSGLVLFLPAPLLAVPALPAPSDPAFAHAHSAVGPIRQIVRGDGDAPRRCLVIAAGTPDKLGAPVQVQIE